MRHSKNSFLGRAALAAATLAGLLMFTGATNLSANDGCQRRIAKADHKLHEAIEHHGYESRQAEHARMELHNARKYCWAHSHRWWDVEGNRWHSDRDWDDHDHEHHDHDRDHDRDHQ